MTEEEHVTEDQLGGKGTTARERDLRDLWEHTKRRDHEVADALVVISEHAAGVTTTGPLCPPSPPSWCSWRATQAGEKWRREAALVLTLLAMRRAAGSVLGVVVDARALRLMVGSFCRADASRAPPDELNRVRL